MTLRAIALDLSLDAPGYAWTTLIDPPVDAVTVPARSPDPQQRADAVVKMLRSLLTIQPNLVVIEDIFVGKNAKTTISLAELHGVIKHELWSRRIPFVTVNQTYRAMYATGNGNAPKHQVMSAARYIYGEFIGGASRIQTTDDADALILLAMALDFYGQPLLEVDGTRRRALLANIAWPAINIDALPLYPASAPVKGKRT